MEPIINLLSTVVMLLTLVINNPGLPADVRAQALSVAGGAYQAAQVEIVALQSAQGFSVPIQTPGTPTQTPGTGLITGQEVTPTFTASGVAEVPYDTVPNGFTQLTTCIGARINVYAPNNTPISVQNTLSGEIQSGVAGYGGPVIIAGVTYDSSFVAQFAPATSTDQFSLIVTVASSTVRTINYQVQYRCLSDGHSLERL